jgi:hypothetical protein
MAVQIFNKKPPPSLRLEQMEDRFDIDKMLLRGTKKNWKWCLESPISSRISLFSKAHVIITFQGYGQGFLTFALLIEVFQGSIGHRGLVEQATDDAETRHLSTMHVEKEFTNNRRASMVLIRRCGRASVARLPLTHAKDPRKSSPSSRRCMEIAVISAFLEQWREMASINHPANRDAIISSSRKSPPYAAQTFEPHV